MLMKLFYLYIIIKISFALESKEFVITKMQSEKNEVLHYSQYSASRERFRIQL